MVCYNNGYKPEKIVTDEVISDLDQIFEKDIDLTFVIVSFCDRWITKTCNHIHTRNWTFWQNCWAVSLVDVGSPLGNCNIPTNLRCPIWFKNKWHRTVHNGVNIFVNGFKFTCIKALIIWRGILFAVIIEVSLQNLIGSFNEKSLPSICLKLSAWYSVVKNMRRVDENIHRHFYIVNSNVTYSFISIFNLYFKASSKKPIANFSCFETGCIIAFYHSSWLILQLKSFHEIRNIMCHIKESFISGLGWIAIKISICVFGKSIDSNISEITIQMIKMKLYLS